MDIDKVIETQIGDLRRKTGSKVRLASPAEVDGELPAWIRTAHEAAG